MPEPIEGYVRPIVRPLEERIAGVITRAWKSWWESQMRKDYAFKRVRACLVHENMVREARTEFANDHDVHIIEGPETIYLLIKGAVAARLKKGDPAGLGRNNHTQTSLGFVSASAEVYALPLGLPDVQRVDITYVLNDLETRIEEILVAGRDGGKRLWSYAIYPREAMPVALLPSPPIVPVNPADVVSVPVRRVDKKDAG